MSEAFIAGTGEDSRDVARIASALRVDVDGQGDRQTAFFGVYLGSAQAFVGRALDRYAEQEGKC